MWSGLSSFLSVKSGVDVADRSTHAYSSVIPLDYTKSRKLQSRYHELSLILSPANAQSWTEGKALMATGSPFDPVDIPGSSTKYVVAECNNVSILPRAT